MTHHARPVHFEIFAADPHRISSFYRDLFGWQINQWGDQEYWLVGTGDGNPMAGKPDTMPGINGGIVPRPGPPPQDGQPLNAFVITILVADCQESFDRAVELGGSAVMAPELVPGVGLVARVKDPEGTLFAMLESVEPTPQP